MVDYYLIVQDLLSPRDQVTLKQILIPENSSKLFLSQLPHPNLGGRVLQAEKLSHFSCRLIQHNGVCRLVKLSHYPGQLNLGIGVAEECARFLPWVPSAGLHRERPTPAGVDPQERMPGPPSAVG